MGTCRQSEPQHGQHECECEADDAEQDVARLPTILVVDEQAQREREREGDVCAQVEHCEGGAFGVAGKQVYTIHTHTYT